jgi:uncharacterized cupredoxin-like copper-binding protein
MPGHRFTKILTLLIAFGASLALISCASESSDAPPVVTFVGSDYAFEGPSEIPAGMTELVIQNEGGELHQIQLIKLDEGKTLDDLATLMAEGAMAPPDWAHLVGGPNAAMPGQSASAYVDLEPGTYAMTCDIPNAEGKLHTELGMAGSFTVTEGEASGASAPEADVMVDGKDFAFEFSDDIQAGDHVFSFSNKGGQPHEAVLIKLEGEATADEFASYFGPDAPPGPPPGAGVGGVVALDPGMSQSFKASLDAGRYAFICFLPDPSTEAPHFALGMQQTFEVR